MLYDSITKLSVPAVNHLRKTYNYAILLDLTIRLTADHVKRWTQRYYQHVQVQYSSAYNLSLGPILRALKVDFYSTFYFRYICYFIYIYCRKHNAEFHKLINSVGHSASFPPEEWCWTHPPLPTILTLFEYFHILTYQVLKF